MNRSGTLLIALALLAATVAAHAGDTGWQDRGNRYEGIKLRPVDGDRFDFVGIRVKSVLPSTTDTLVLSIPKSCRLGASDHVDVREDAQSYWMTPKHPESLTDTAFTWPTGDVIRRAGIDPARLRTAVRKDATGVYCPARLGTPGEPTPGSHDYVFTFNTSADVAFDWSIVALDSGATVFEQTNASGDRERCEIVWPGVQGQPGRHQLKVRGRGESNAGDFKINLSVDFDVPDGW